MRLRRIPHAREEVSRHSLMITEQQALDRRGNWQQLFPQPQPLHLEIGMGRGRFIIACAAAHPENNYLGMERRAEPLLSAIERLGEPYPANLRLLNADASILTQFFAPGELETVYLNFSDPWPKSRHAKRRLTAPAYLQQYQIVLQPAGRLLLKTDGAEFYRWSCENFAAAGWKIESTAYPEGGLLTEYEIRYRSQGKEIFYAEFEKP